MLGISTERIDLFLAPFAAIDSAGSDRGLATEQEDIMVSEHRLTDLLVMARTGSLSDMKTLLLV